MNRVDELDEALAAFAVHTAMPAKRRELAGYLASEGVSVDDVVALGQHCEKTLPEAKVPVVLISLLTAAGKREERLAELGRTKEARAKILERAPGDRAYSDRPTEGETQEQWQHDRNCRIAYCAVVSDRRDKAAVAKDLGVQLGAKFDAMIERGRALQCARHVPATGRDIDDEATQNERRKRFVEAMKAGRDPTVLA